MSKYWPIIILCLWVSSLWLAAGSAWYGGRADGIRWAAQQIYGDKP